MRADDERRLAVAVEAALEGALQHQLLLGGTASNPVIQVAVQRGCLHPGHGPIPKVAQHPVEIVRSGAVINIELDKDVVAVPVLGQPSVDIARLGLGLEGGDRQVVAVVALAREVAHPQARRRRADRGIRFLVQDPALVGVADAAQCLELTNDDGERLLGGDAQRDQGDLEPRWRLERMWVAHLANEVQVHGWQEAGLVSPGEGEDAVQPGRAHPVRLEPPPPEHAVGGEPEHSQKVEDAPRRAGKHGVRLDGQVRTDGERTLAQGDERGEAVRPAPLDTAPH